MSLAPLQYRRPRTSAFFKDFDGVLTMVKREDEVMPFAENFTDDLASGETISSVSWDESGVTVTAKANTSVGHTANVKGLGEATITVTFSSGHTDIQTYRWLGASNSVGDYA